MILRLVILPETNHQQGCLAHLDIQLLSRLSLCFVRHARHGWREVGIPGCSLYLQSFKSWTHWTLEYGVHTADLTEFHGLKQVNPSNCQIPSLFVSLEGK